MKLRLVYSVFLIRLFRIKKSKKAYNTLSLGFENRNFMNVLVFKTDIKSMPNVKAVKSLLLKIKSVVKLSVDIEDVDNVLRIEVLDELPENEVIQLVENNGFQCEVLTC